MNPLDQKAIDSAKNSFWGFFVNNWRVTLLIIGTAFVFGLFSLSALPLESDPEVEIPIAMVMTTYPGAAPRDMEELVTNRLEEKFKGLENLKKIESQSSEGVSSISVEFETEADLTESIRNLRDEVDNAKSDLPDGANDPIVAEIRLDDQPIIVISVLTNLPPEEMKDHGENLQDLLESIPGVSEVLLSGVEKKEVQVLVDIQKLEGFGISLSGVVNAISGNHIDFPIGSIRTDGFYYTASLKAQFETADELLELPIDSRGEQNIYLRDVAEVREAFREKTSTTRVVDFVSGEEYSGAANLQVKKKTGANIIEIADAVKIAAEEYRSEKMPPTSKILITNDWSKYIHDSITTLGRSGLQTVFLIFVVLFVALGLKEGLMVGFSIPLIFLITFVGLNYCSETLNDLVLFSLVLSLGLLVDTSIVIMEGIFEGVKEKGLTGRDAALLAVRTYRAPLISGTLTTIAVFIPMAMMTGIMGEFIKHIPITVTITLVSSLFVALFILPAIAARVFRDYHKKVEHEKDRKPLLARFIVPLRKWYLRKIRIILHSKKIRRRWIWGSVAAFLITVSFPIVGILPVELFPSVDFEYFNVNVEMPIGTVMEDTAAITEKVEKLVEGLPEVDNFVTIVGQSSAGLSIFASSQSGTNVASVTVNLKAVEDRKMKSYDIAEIMREKIKPLTASVETIEVSEVSAGPPTGAPVELRIFGENIDVIEKFAGEVKKIIAEIPGTRDITTGIEHGTGEFHFKLKRDRLNFYGVTAMQVGAELRTAVFGNDSVKILRDGKEMPIVVSLDFREEECRNDRDTKLLERRDKITLCRNDPKNISIIENLLIATPKGVVPVSDLAEISINPAVTSIGHRDGETVVNIRAYSKEGFLPADIAETALAKIDKLKISGGVPDGVRIEIGGETEDITESFVSLGRAMLVGFFMIILILVIQFNSYRQPFIIAFALPLALIGVFTGLVLTGRNFSFPGFIGIVALLGVVVNDAIVLIDRINHNIARGMQKVEAIIVSGGERLQPIILTTVTTALGVLPLVFADEMWIDLALAIFFGMLFSTFLTLIMVPILFNWLETEKEIREVEHQN